MGYNDEERKKNRINSEIKRWAIGWIVVIFILETILTIGVKEGKKALTESMRERMAKPAVTFFLPDEGGRVYIDLSKVRRPVRVYAKGSAKHPQIRLIRNAEGKYRLEGIINLQRFSKDNLHPAVQFENWSVGSSTDLTILSGGTGNVEVTTGGKK